MSAIEKLIADYEHLAFPEDDRATRKSRERRVASALKQLADLNRTIKSQRETYNNLENASNIQKLAIDELREALRHAHQRHHEHRPRSCAGCKQIEELLKPQQERE